jgi:hypothetical protein
MSDSVLNYDDIEDYRFDPFTGVISPKLIGYGANAPETRTVPGASPYQIKLFESPQENAPSTTRITKVVGGAELTEVSKTTVPANNQYRVNYDEEGNGIIEFNSAQAGVQLNIQYYGLGSLFQKITLDTRVPDTGNTEIGGIKTFTSIPILPATNPTTDNQATRKKYVDDSFFNRSEFICSIVGNQGNKTTVAGAGAGRLTALTSSRIAYIDSTNDDLRTYETDGTDWTQTGNDLNIPTTTSGTRLASLSSSTIALFDYAGDEDLRTYSFDGTNWSQVGNDLNIAGAGGADITELSSTRIAFYDVTNQTIRTYDFDGTDWSQTGNALNIGNIGQPALATLTSSRIVVTGATNKALRAYDFDGTDWSAVGNSFSLPATVGTPSIIGLTSSQIAHVSGTEEKVRIYTFDGTDWTLESNEFTETAADNTPALTAISNNRLVTTGFTSGVIATVLCTWSPVFNTVFQDL